MYFLVFLCIQSIIDRIWGKWAWLQQEFYGVTPNGTDTASPEDADDAEKLIAIVALEEELDDFQPLYRNPLLQRLYALDSDCSLSDDDDSMYRFGFAFFVFLIPLNLNGNAICFQIE